MITQELIDYIRLLRQQGKSDEHIRTVLSANKWTEPDINEALLQLNDPASNIPTPLDNNQPSASIPAQSQPVAQHAGYGDTSTEGKSKVTKPIATLLFLIAGFYFLSTINMLGVMVVMERVFSFLQYFPTWGLVPILFSLLTVVFLYVAFKIRNGSRFSLWLGIGPLVTVFPVAFIIHMLIAPFVSFTSSLSETAGDTLPMNFNMFRFGDLIFVLALISLVLLFMSFKKFQFSNDPLSRRVKVFLTIFTVVFVLPTVSFISLGYIKANDTDFGYTDAQSQVTYHIYKLSPLPPDLVNATKFLTDKELAGRQDAVRVAYDVPFDVGLTTGQSKLIVVTQVGVGPGFDVGSFAATFVQDATVQQIPLTVGANQTGYLLQRTSESLVITAVVYITSDNVLITLMSPGAGSDELIRLAEGLR